MNPWTLGNTLKWPPSWVVGEKQSSQDDWSRKFDTSPSHILEHGSTSGTHGNYGSLFSSSRCWRRNRKLPGRFWSSFWLWLGPQDFRRWIGERTWTERSRGYLGVIIIWESPRWSMALLTRNGDLKEFFWRNQGSGYGASFELATFLFWRHGTGQNLGQVYVDSQTCIWFGHA